MSLYCLPNARIAWQHQEMAALEKAGICIFCPTSWGNAAGEVLLEHEGGTSYRKEILDETEGFALLRNEYPYDNTLIHVMVVPRRHITRLDELTDTEWLDYARMRRRVSERLGSYYSTVCRNGIMLWTGATIAHVHEQYAVQDPDATGPVVAYIGKPRQIASSPSVLTG